MFWRQMGGHLKKVETCNSDVTWGIGYDSTAWVYTGGWGGTSLKGLKFYSFYTNLKNTFELEKYFCRIRLKCYWYQSND